jgi:hypothetical protein
LRGAAAARSTSSGSSGSANCGPDFRNGKRVSDADFDLLVRNVDKVLLTRGLRGVYLYSTDAETQRFLDSLVP